MLANAGRRVLKQGWVYKRGSNLLSQWKLKWLVLYELSHATAPTNSVPHVVLCVFDQRDQAAQGVRPKHTVEAETITIEIPEDLGLKSNWWDRKPKLAPFVLSTRQRRFYFSAQSKKDRDDWTSILQQHSPNAISRRPMEHFVTEEDMASVYSEGSNMTSASQRPYSAMYQGPADDTESVGTYATGGLSFCSTTVLTPQELNMLGRCLNHKRTEDARRKQTQNDVFSSNTNLSPDAPWNDNYQVLLGKPAQTNEVALEKDVKMCEIIGSFQELAHSYGKKIIDEYHSKSARKQSNSGNEDGLDPSLPGTYKYGNIYFHFAADYDEEDMESIEAQVAKTSHELKAINAINQTEVDLHTTLMCLIDYKGFRMVAYAAMPLREQETVVLDLTSEEPRIDDGAVERLCLAGSKLRLKEHSIPLTYDRRLVINLSATVEVHKCPQTSSLYALNLCEVFPIDHPMGENFKNLNTSSRLRPEFVRNYKAVLSSDAFTTYAYSRKEKEQNDSEVLLASKYLRETWIPQFVKKLDDLVILPIDSKSFTEELHSHGINMRHIGIIAKSTKLPYVRDLCFIEMVARACKCIFRNRLRKAVFHFRSVEATRIDEEMKSYIVSFFQSLLNEGSQREKFWEEKLFETIATKFQIKMEFSQFASLPKGALFLSLQYHCGVKFEDSLDYNFEMKQQTPIIQKRHFIEFIPKTKSLSGLPKTGNSLPEMLNEEDKHVYFLARHLASVGPQAKLMKNDTSAQILNNLAKYYNMTGRYEEARFYLNAALNLASQNHAATSIIYANMMETTFMLQHDQSAGPDNTVMEYYKRAAAIIEFHWGMDHPLMMALHDKLAFLFCKVGLNEDGLKYHQSAMVIAFKTLGKNHLIAAGHLTRAGHIYLNLALHDEAIQHFSDSLTILQSFVRSAVASAGSNNGSNGSIPPQTATAIAENHYCIAECLYAKGDIEGAMKHSYECRKLRERTLGPMHPMTVDTYKQFAKLVMTNYEDYDGVMTPHVKKCFQSAIACYDKVFKFVKSGKDRVGKSAMHNSQGGGNQGLLDLVRIIARLKFRVLNRVHQEALRTARQTEKHFPEDAVKDVILKLVHLTPTVYIDEVLQRVDDQDDAACDELGIVVQLVESENLALN